VAEDQFFLGCKTVQEKNLPACPVRPLTASHDGNRRRRGCSHWH
jgi:hypothetical protein